MRYLILPEKWEKTNCIKIEQMEFYIYLHVFVWKYLFKRPRICPNINLSLVIYLLFLHNLMEPGSLSNSLLTGWFVQPRSWTGIIILLFKNVLINNKMMRYDKNFKGFFSITRLIRITKDLIIKEETESSISSTSLYYFSSKFLK